MDLSALAPAPGTGLAKRVVNRTTSVAGPNPFLDNGWLKKSFDEGKDYVVTVDGGWEMQPAKRGANKGEPIEKLVGDAYKVTRMIRDAADKLGLGVTIQYSVPTVTKKVKGKDVTEDVPGKVNVHYQGKTRKAPRRASVSVQTVLNTEGQAVAQQ